MRRAENALLNGSPTEALNAGSLASAAAAGIVAGSAMITLEKTGTNIVFNVVLSLEKIPRIGPPRNS